MKASRWHIPDLLDLEFFLDQDEGEGLEALAARDRDFFSHLSPSENQKDIPPASILFSWLAARRKEFRENSNNSVLPGRVGQEVFVLFFWGAQLGGLFSGASVAFSFLSYGGTRPVNVSAYFGFFVVFEVVLFVLMLSMSAYRKILGHGLEHSFLYGMLLRMFFKMMDSLARRSFAHASSEQSMQWKSWSGSMKKMQQRYGSLFMRPFFLLAQLFGVAFNAGVLAATLLKVIGSDVAFGWQTTLQVNSESIYNLVRLVSIPWAWLVPGHCCPSPAQIEGSRLVLKDGMYHLATPALVSWWPFLCLSVGMYALLPRFIVWIGGMLQQRKKLNALRFDSGRYRQLFHRMRTPVLATRAVAESKPQCEPKQEYKGKTNPIHLKNSAKEQATAQQPLSPSKKKGPERAQTSASVEAVALPDNQVISPLVVLVPEELADDFAQQDLQHIITARLGYESFTMLPIWTLAKTEEEERALVIIAIESLENADLCIVQEAWQPPIQELLRFLTSIRHTIGEQTTITIGLIGRPDPDSIFTPVDPVQAQTWNNKIATLADPGIQIVELVS